MLSGVCVIFRNIFPPYLPTKVYIDGMARPRHIRQRLSAFAECPSLLRDISEIEVGTWLAKWKKPAIPPVLSFRAALSISAFLRNVPHMPRLHTACFFWMKVKQEHLALLFQSNNLHHLRLLQCDLPKSIRLPPSPIRYLTLSLKRDCKHMEPLLGHCSANLETLDFAGHLPQLSWSTTPPLFPKLRILRFGEAHGSISHLDTLISFAPQLEHVEVNGHDSLSRLSALPANLNHFSICRRMIDGDIGTYPFVHLPHLHIKYYHHLARNDHRGSVIPIIQRVFPNLTSLDLDIKWGSRNVALLLARHLPSVTRLKLNISRSGVYEFDISPYPPSFAEHGGPLASLYLNVEYPSKYSMGTYKGWAISTVLRPNLGLGGPYLQEVEIVIANPRDSVVLGTYGKGGSLQSIQSIERRMCWVYSRGQIYEGPYVRNHDSR